MYLHLGEDTSIITNSIVGVFDIENTSIGKDTKNFLAKAEKSGQVVNVNYDMPKSFIISTEKVYISPISTSTIKKRAMEDIKNG